MKVIYEDPDGREGTYHPQLGYLESGKAFDLSDDQAALYLKTGLLKRVQKGRMAQKGEDVEIDSHHGKQFNSEPISKREA